MKKQDLVILFCLAVLFGFFIVTADDRGRYVISILPMIAVIIAAFRPRK